MVPLGPATPADIFARNVAGTEYVWEVAVDFSRWTTSRRILSRRQLHEVMTDFPDLSGQRATVFPGPVPRTIGAMTR